jgi:hypothetical protein
MKPGRKDSSLWCAHHQERYIRNHRLRVVLAKISGRLLLADQFLRPENILNWPLHRGSGWYLTIAMYSMKLAQRMCQVGYSAWFATES